ncbi:hypothetical protein, partial [Aeromonas hydrophila]|uniref:hypothetical protein n=1 Tax=Aeromonas hydrophila TaxID=644 RepID=UPI00190F924E
MSGDLKPGATLTVDPAKLDYFDEDNDAHDIAAVKYSWKLDGVEISTVNTVTLPSGSSAVGKPVTLEVTPMSESGDPLKGNVLLLNNLNIAGAGGGDGNGNVDPDVTAKPVVKSLNMTGTLLQGSQLAATYVFDSNGGEPTDKSTYAWGHQGTTAVNVGADVVVTAGVVPAYTISTADAGEVIEVSVQATNGMALKGNTLTVDTNGKVTDIGDGNTGGGGSGSGEVEGGGDGGEVPYLKLDPIAVVINFNSTATEALNGVEGVRPVAAKDLMTAVITPAEGASPNVADYTFQWK